MIRGLITWKIIASRSDPYDRLDPSFYCYVAPIVHWPFQPVLNGWVPPIRKPFHLIWLIFHLENQVKTKLFFFKEMFLCLWTHSVSFYAVMYRSETWKQKSATDLNLVKICRLSVITLVRKKTCEGNLLQNRRCMAVWMSARCGNVEPIFPVNFCFRSASPIS